MTTLPATRGSWKTAQNGDLFGDAIITKALNFDEEGYAKLARKPMWLGSEDDDTLGNFGIVTAIVAGSAHYLIATTEGYFKLTPSDSAVTFAAIASNAPTASDQSDAVSCFGKIYASGTTTVKSWDGSSWTDGLSGLSSSYPHPLCYFENKDRLAVANGQTVTLYNDSLSANSDVLTIPKEYVIVWMRWKRDSLYIGTKNISGGSAKMFIWDGTGTQAIGETVNAKWIYSGFEYDSSICVITSEGQCLRYNGGGFDVLFNFPIYYNSALEWIPDNYSTTLLGKVPQRGVVVKGNIIYMNIDGSANTRTSVEPPGELLINQPSGIWVFDPKVGLYHKSGYAGSKFANISVSSLSSNTLTMASEHEALTGDACLLTAAGSLTDGTSALTAGHVFYVIRVSDTEIKLALTAQDAVDGNDFDLSGSAGSAKIAFDTYDSFGNTYDTTPGAIAPIQNGLSPSIFFGSEILFGAYVTTKTGLDSKATLQSFGMGRNVGHLVTPKTLTSNLTETYQSFVSRIRNIITDSDKIVIKYRTKEIGGLPTQVKYSGSGLAAWTNGLEFAVDSRYKSFHQAKDGFEVEIVSGAGAGQTAHFDGDPEYSAPSYSYVSALDEEILGPITGSKSEVVVDNWIKAGEITRDGDDIERGLGNTNLEGASSWVQFKVELRGFEVKLESADINSIQHSS